MQGRWMGVALAMALLPGSGPVSRAEEAFAPLVTRQDAAGELPGWKSFSEASGTKTGDVWRLDATGVLACRGTPKGYLYTEAPYADFTLRLEWRWPETPGKGGVLLRMSGPQKIWPKCLEAQINVPDAGDFWGLDGYRLAGPAERMKAVAHPQFGALTNLKKTADAERPAGQWNSYEIDARGGTVVLRINGQEVNRCRDADAQAGAICLTAEGTPIEFRRIELRR